MVETEPSTSPVVAESIQSDAVVITTKTNTRCMEYLSIFQALSYLSESCLNGSPKVSANSPHPQTHEQYHLLPKKYVNIGVAIKVIVTPEHHKVTKCTSTVL